MNDDSTLEPQPLSAEELAAEAATPLPDKEVASILDLNADLNLGLGLVAPVDLGVAANANVAAPIDAAVSANIGSDHAVAQSLADQQVDIHQSLDNVEANATAEQDSTVDQQ
jgi:hypothetical protein